MNKQQIIDCLETIDTKTDQQFEALGLAVGLVKKHAYERNYGLREDGSIEIIPGRYPTYVCGNCGHGDYYGDEEFCKYCSSDMWVHLDDLRRPGANDFIRQMVLPRSELGRLLGVAK